MDITQAIERMRERRHVPLFTTAIWDPALDHRLRTASEKDLFGNEIREPAMAAATLAGLHIWNDNFASSHNICQALDNPTGAYWHAICHRREGHKGDGLAANLTNAGYWFRRVGDHPVYDIMLRSATGVLESSGSGFRWATEAASALHAQRKWDPFALVDWFGQAEAGTISSATIALLEEIQWREIDLLTDWCLKQAIAAG